MLLFSLLYSMGVEAGTSADCGEVGSESDLAPRALWG